MYTLRMVDSNQKQTNQLIGNIYSLIDRNSNYNEFSGNFRMLFGKSHVADLDENSDEHTKNVYAILDFMGDMIPLYKDTAYYIMTESGKTFSNLSYR